MLMDYDCPECESRNSVEVDRASVKGNTIEVVLACKKCRVSTPFIRCDIKTMDMREIYTNWYEASKAGRRS
jgi:transcription elongation factor Elf1